MYWGNLEAEWISGKFEREGSHLCGPFLFVKKGYRSLPLSTAIKHVILSRHLRLPSFRALRGSHDLTLRLILFSKNNCDITTHCVDAVRV